MDLADFVPSAMLPTQVQDANFSLSQRQFKIVGGHRDRDNSEPRIILYLCFHAPILWPLRCFLKDRPNQLKDVRWRATPSALLSRGLARGSREAGRLPDLESPHQVPQSCCCSATGGSLPRRQRRVHRIL